MNIYEVVSGCERELPNGKVRKLFASAELGTKDQEWLTGELQGRQFSKPWRTLELHFDDPKLPRADFPGFEWPALLCNERAMAAVGDILRVAGELLPVKLRGDKGTYLLHNIPVMRDGLLDRKRSTWRTIAGERCLHVPAFRGDYIGTLLKLFKIPEDHGLGIYCIERTGDPKDHEFKALVDRHRLTGLRFNLVWTDGKGPSGKKSRRTAAKEKADEPTLSDRPLKRSEQRDITLSIKRGYQHLKLDPKSPPLKTQQAIRHALDAIVLGKKKPSRTAITDLAVNLGCLWGQTVCDELGWQWCCVMLGAGQETYAIVTPNRSHMVSPMDFVFTQLQKRPPEDNTSMLLFNMLKAGSFGSAKPRSYVHVG